MHHHHPVNGDGTDLALFIFLVFRLFLQEGKVKKHLLLLFFAVVQTADTGSTNTSAVNIFIWKSRIKTRTDEVDVPHPVLSYLFITQRRNIAGFSWTSVHCYDTICNNITCAFL